MGSIFSEVIRLKGILTLGRMERYLLGHLQMNYQLFVTTDKNNTPTQVA